MASKKNEFDLDDISFDDIDFDIPNFDEAPEKDNRKPTTRFLSGTFKGAKKQALRLNNLERLARSALPPGYAQALNVKDNAIDTAQDLYRGLVEELRPASHVIGRSADRLLNSSSAKRLPTWMKRRLEAMSQQSAGGSYSASAAKAAQQQNEVSSALADIFRQQTELEFEQNQRDKAEQTIKDAADQKIKKAELTYQAVIARGVDRLVGFQDGVLNRFQKKTLELQYRHLFVARDLYEAYAESSKKMVAALDSIVKNTALPEAVKIQKSELTGQLLKERMINAGLDSIGSFSRNYIQNLTKNARSSIGNSLGSLTGMGGMLPEDVDKATLLGGALGEALVGFGTEQAGNWINPKLAGNRKLRAGNASLRTLFTGMSRRADRFAKSDTEGFGYGSTMMQWFKDQLPRFYLNDKAGSMSLNEFDRPAIFDNMTRRSIVEVIPSHLAEIERWAKALATGQIDGPRRFNFTRGGFTGEKEIQADIRRAILPRGENITLQRELDSVIDKLDEEKSLSEEARNALRRQMLQDVASGEEFNAADYASRSRYKTVGDEQTIEQLREFFAKKFEVGLDGTVGSDRSLEARERVADTKVAYENVGNLVPAIGDRVRAMVNIFGRDELVKLGIISRVGRQDVIDYGKAFDLILSEEMTEGDKTLYQTSEEREKQFKDLPLNERIRAQRELRLKQANLVEKRARGAGDELPFSTQYDGQITTAGGLRASGSDAVRVSLDTQTLDPYFSENSQLINEIRALRQSVINTSSLEESARTAGILARIEAMLSAGAMARSSDGQSSSFTDRVAQAATKEESDLEKRIRGRMEGLKGDASNLAAQLGDKAKGSKAYKKGSLLVRATKSYFKMWGNFYKVGGKATARALGFGLRKSLGLGIGTAKLTAKGLMQRASDAAVMVKGKAEPAITEAMLKSKELIDVKTGEVVKRLEDITGEVRNKAGEVVISAEDFANGLYNKHGRPLIARAASAYGRYMTLPWRASWGAAKGVFNGFNRLRGKGGALSGAGGALADYGSEALGLMKDTALLPIKAGTWGLRKARGLVGKMSRFFSGRASSGVSISLTGDNESDLVQVNVAQLQILDKIYSALSPKRNIHDTDGDGIRNGSVFDILRRRREKEQEKKDAAKGEDKNSKGLLGKLLAGIGSLGNIFKKAGEEAGDDGDTNIITGDIGGGDKKGKPGKGGGGGGGKKGILRRLAGWGKSLLVGAGRLAWGGGRLALSVGGWVARAVVWKALVGLTGIVAGVVGSPVIAGALVVGGVAAASYGLYRYLSGNYRPIVYLRMAQYGFDIESKKPATQLLWMESFLEGNVSYTEHEAKMSFSQEQVARIMERFGHKPESADPEQIAQFRNWVENRFKPVFLTYMKVKHDMGIAGKIGDLDDKVPVPLGVEFIESVKCLEVNFDAEESPFTFAKVTEDSGDVRKLINKAINHYKNANRKAAAEEGKNRLTTEGLKEGAAASMAAGRGGIAARNLAAMKAQAKSSVNLSTAGLTTSGLLGKSGLRVEMVSGTAPLVINREGMKLGLDEAARFTVYGIREMEADKVDTLRALEAFHFSKVVYNQGTVASVDVDYSQVMSSFMARFGVATDDGTAKGDWNTWYRYRFLPAFLSYCSAVRARENINAADAGRRMKPLVVRAVLADMTQAKTTYKGKDVSIWAVETSPWPGHLIETSASSLMIYLDALKELSREKVYSTDVMKLTGKDPAKGPKAVDAKDNLPLVLKGYRDGTITQRSNYLDRAVAGIKQQNSIQGVSMMASTAASSAGSFGRSVPHPGGGSGGDINQLPIPKGDGWAAGRDTILGAAKIVGFDPVISATVAAKESSFRPYVKNPNSSATGYFQFIDSTWAEMMEKYASKYGINPSATQMDARANAILGVQYLKDNYNYLKNNLNKSDITDTDLYLAHFLGPAGAVRFLNAPMDDLATRHVASNVPSANSSIFFQGGRPVSVRDVYSSFDSSLKSRRAMHDADKNPLSSEAIYQDAVNDPSAFEAPVAANDSDLVSLTPPADGQESGKKSSAEAFTNQRFTTQAFAGQTAANYRPSMLMAPAGAGSMSEAEAVEQERYMSVETQAKVVAKQAKAKEEAEQARSSNVRKIQEKMLEQQTRAADYLETITAQLEEIKASGLKSSSAAEQPARAGSGGQQQRQPRSAPSAPAAMKHGS